MSKKCALFHMKTRVSLKYFVTDCLWKPFLNSNLSKTPSNFQISLIILVTPRPFTLFQPKIRLIKLQNMLKFALLCDCCSNLFTELIFGIKRISSLF